MALRQLRSTPVGSATHDTLTTQETTPAAARTTQRTSQPPDGSGAFALQLLALTLETRCCELQDPVILSAHHPAEQRAQCAAVVQRQRRSASPGPRRDPM